MGKKFDKKILLDCDVIIHFIKGGQQFLLPQIFPNSFVILDKVLSELDKRKSNFKPIENFLQWCKVDIIKMPSDPLIIKEYAVLKKSVGEGEAACMAVAKHTKDYIASSNLSDIKDFCNDNDITYLTTMDILLEAFEKGLLTESECDLFIYEVKSKGSKLISGIDKIVDYKEFKNIYS